MYALQFGELHEISDRYEAGFQYAEYVRHLPPPSSPYASQQYTFEPYNADVKGYELRKPSNQSSGSGSDLLYLDESPLATSREYRRCYALVML